MTAATVTLTTTLPTSADRAFAAVLKPALLVHVARRLARFPQLEGRWTRGARARRSQPGSCCSASCRSPRHRLTVARIDADRRELKSDEASGPIRHWRLIIRVEPLAAGTCRYTDEVHIDAGPLTPLVRAWPEIFYRHRHRQRRWQALARRHHADV